MLFFAYEFCSRILISRVVFNIIVCDIHILFHVRGFLSFIIILCIFKLNYLIICFKVILFQNYTKFYDV